MESSESEPKRSLQIRKWTGTRYEQVEARRCQIARRPVRGNGKVAIGAAWQLGGSIAMNCQGVHGNLTEERHLLSPVRLARSRSRDLAERAVTVQSPQLSQRQHSSATVNLC